MDILQHLFGVQMTLERVSFNFHWGLFIILVIVQYKMTKSCISRMGRKKE